MGEGPVRDSGGSGSPAFTFRSKGPGRTHLLWDFSDSRRRQGARFAVIRDLRLARATGTATDRGEDRHMKTMKHPMAFGVAVAASAGLVILDWQGVRGQQPPTVRAASKAAPPHDPAAEAQTARPVPVDRPEQRLSEHDRS